MTTPTLTSVTPTDLHDLVDALKRELAVPGEFGTVFPNTSDDDLVASLGDAFAMAQLEGFFGSQSLNLTSYVVTSGLSAGGAALVLLYAAERIVQAQLRNLRTSVKYEAGGVVYEVQSSANVLSQELKAFATRRESLLLLILRSQRAGAAVYVTDGYLTRAFGYLSRFGLFGEFGFGELGLGFYAWELP